MGIAHPEDGIGFFPRGLIRGTEPPNSPEQLPPYRILHEWTHGGISDTLTEDQPIPRDSDRKFREPILNSEYGPGGSRGPLPSPPQRISYFLRALFHSSDTPTPCKTDPRRFSHCFGVTQRGTHETQRSVSQAARSARTQVPHLGFFWPGASILSLGNA